MAQRMVDCARGSCTYGGIGLRSLAFSPPTFDGRAFAQQYTGQRDFLVYTDFDQSPS